MGVCVCVCVCVRARARACVRCVCVRACNVLESAYAYCGGGGGVRGE